FPIPATATTVLSALSLHDALPISLRGVAAVSDHAELGALLDALDMGLRGANVPLAGSTHATLSNAARMLRVASDDIRAGRNITRDRKSTRLNSSHVKISYAVFCLK